MKVSGARVHNVISGLEQDLHQNASLTPQAQSCVMQRELEVYPEEGCIQRKLQIMVEDLCDDA